MNCDEFVELVTAHLEGTLDDETERRVVEHLALCDGCARYLQQVRHTVDTLADLHKALPDAQLFFITGADALAQILSWREAEQVFRYAHFIGVTRPGYELGDDHLPEGAVTLIEVPAMAISSTDCRRRVEGGRPVWYLVPDGVVQYIAKRHLYGRRTAAST
jgi:nicotinate-nucleotide adenylyltransferase